MGEQLTGADAAWLHMDRPTNRMIVNMVSWFDEEPDWDEMRAALQKRWVDVYPRFRQVVREPALPLGKVALPEWVEVDDFNLDDHIVTERLTSPGTTRLCTRTSSGTWPTRCRRGSRCGRCTSSAAIAAAARCCCARATPSATGRR